VTKLCQLPLQQLHEGQLLQAVAAAPYAAGAQGEVHSGAQHKGVVLQGCGLLLQLSKGLGQQLPLLVDVCRQ
jgi:hypothetical protein